MTWTSLVWIVIAIVAVFLMARMCGGMMGGMRGGGCGMPRRREDTQKKDSENPPTGKAA
jgi:hypothetical protein